MLVKYRIPRRNTIHLHLRSEINLKEKFSDCIKEKKERNIEKGKIINFYSNNHVKFLQTVSHICHVTINMTDQVNLDAFVPMNRVEANDGRDLSRKVLKDFFNRSRFIGTLDQKVAERGHRFRRWQTRTKTATLKNRINASDWIPARRCD